MKIVKFLILFLLLQQTPHILAQAENAGYVSIDVIKKKIKLNALETVSQYEGLCGVGSDYEEVDFLRLFESYKTLVVNDIMPSNMLDSQIPVIEYKEKRDSFHADLLVITIKPYNVDFLSMNENSLTGELWVDAYKSIQTIDKNNGITYADTLDIRISIRFDYSAATYKISGISLNSGKGKYAILHFYVKDFLREPQRAGGPVLINGQPGSIGIDSSCFIKDIAEVSQQKVTLVTNDGNITQKLNFSLVEEASHKNGAEKNIVQLFFKPPHLFGEFSYSFTPNKMPPIHANSTYEIKTFDGSLYSFDASMGIIAYKWPNGYLHIKSGIGYTRLAYSLSLNKHMETYIATDSDKTTYERTNTISDIEEKNTIRYFSVPVIIERGIYLPKKFRLVLQAGGVIIAGISGSHSSSANAKYSGYYKELFGIHIAENGVYDFGNYKLTEQGKLNTKNILAGFTAHIGIARKITQKLHFGCGFTYLHTMDNLFNQSNNKLSSYSGELNSLTGVYNQFNLRFYTITAGIKQIF